MTPRIDYAVNDVVIAGMIHLLLGTEYLPVREPLPQWVHMAGKPTECYILDLAAIEPARRLELVQKLTHLFLLDPVDVQEHLGTCGFPLPAERGIILTDAASWAGE